MKFAFPVLIVAIVAFLMQGSSAAQVTPGTPPFQTFARGPIDVVNLATGNTHITIPIFHKAGRGVPVDLQLTYDTSIWQTGSAWTPAVAPSQWFGWYLEPIGYATGSSGVTCLQYSGGEVVGVASYETFEIYDPSGTPHGTSASIVTYYGTCTDGNYKNVTFYSPGPADDDSGYTVTPISYNGLVMTDRHGQQTSINNFGTLFPPGTVTDTNGNQLTVNSSGVITDTLGTSVLTMAGSGTPSSPVTLTYTAPSGSPATWTIKFTTLTVKTNFGCTNVGEYGPASQNLVTEIDLPDQGTVPSDKYTFTYEATPGYSGDVTARIASIVLPTGGTIDYTYGGGNNGMDCGIANGAPIGSVPLLTRQTSDGSWTYAHTNDSPTATVTDALGNQTIVNYASGSQYETQRSIYQGSSTSGTLLKTIYTCYNGATMPCSNGGSMPITQKTVYTEWANGSESETNEVYDQESIDNGYLTWSYGLVKEQDDYDYGSEAPGALLRKTTTSYASLNEGVLNDGTVSNPIVDRASQVSVYDGSGNLKAQTTYTYDGSSPVASGITTQHVSMTGSRGNPTTIARLVSSTSTVSENLTYFDTGSVNLHYDGNNNKTTFGYSETYVGAYPTTITNALSQTTTNTYDINSGLLLSTMDPNSQATSYTYDSLFRPLTASYPDGGQTTYSYPSPNQENVSQKIESGGPSRTGSQEVDGLGRKIQQIVSNGETLPYDQVDTCYDADGRVGFKSYPYQGSGLSSSPCPSSNPGDSFTYDALNRTLSVTHSDATSTSTAYVGRGTSFQDEGNGTQRVQKISEVDGLGRLVTLCEATGTALTVGISGSTAPVACGQEFPGYGFLTTYAYDALDNLTSVAQGPLNSRTFLYDGLSRLTSGTNPEAGTTTYTYDANGNVLTREDARSITTTNTYDALNRVTSRTYSDGTPTANYFYDQPSGWNATQINMVGRLSEAWITAGNGQIFSYDPVGRTILNNQYLADTNSYYSIAYTYDLLGDTTSSTNGLGVTLTNTYNAAARLTSVTSSMSDPNHPGTLFGYQNIAHYNAAGSLTSVTLGNTVSENRTYDIRLRLCAIQDGSNGSIYSLAIPSTPTPCPTGSSGYAPDGDVVAANDSVNGNWTYAYDPLNRLASSSQNAGTNTFTYADDRFGNRWNQIVTHGGGPQPAYGFDANNHITGSGVHYDLAGDMTYDGTTTYTYDAEGRVTSANNSLSGSSSYVYDADGRRIRKTTSAGGTVDFLYDLAGHEIAQTSAGSWQRGEIYAGRHHVATYYGGTTYFIHADWLGTERARSNVSGALCESIISLPYGDAMATSGSCGDPSPMHFTVKEHDTETGLENFGARYDSSSMGRFMSPDPLGGHLDNPQSLNKYSYVANSPLTLIDPFGLQSCTLDGASTNCGVAAQVLNIGGTHSGIAAEVCPYTTCGLYRYVQDNQGNNLFLNMVRPGSSSFNPSVQITGGKLGPSTYYLSAMSTYPLDKFYPSKTFNWFTDLTLGAAMAVRPRPSSASMRGAWERLWNSVWPKDATGANYQGNHAVPRTDGGSDDPENIFPVTQQQHVDWHNGRGDYARWAARARIGEEGEEPPTIGQGEPQQLEFDFDSFFDVP